MKIVKMFLMSLLITGFLTSCGEKNESAVCEKDGITLSFSYPKGFFTRSDDAKDYMLGEKDGFAFVGENFTMQVTMGISFGHTELWDRTKQRKIEANNEFFKQMSIEGTKDVYQFYWEPSLAYTMLLDNNRYIEIQFCPNDLKNKTNSDLIGTNRATRAEFLERSRSISESKEVQDIVKSLKVKLSVIND